MNALFTPSHRAGHPLSYIQRHVQASTGCYDPTAPDATSQVDMIIMYHTLSSRDLAVPSKSRATTCYHTLSCKQSTVPTGTGYHDPIGPDAPSMLTLITSLHPPCIRPCARGSSLGSRPVPRERVSARSSSSVHPRKSTMIALLALAHRHEHGGESPVAFGGLSSSSLHQT